MPVWPMIWDLFSIIIYVILGVVLTFFLLGLFFRIFKLNSLRFKPPIIKKGELIKKKMFQTSDAYDLRWYGEINPEGDYIILAIHDLLRTRKDFETFDIWIRKNNYKNFSLVSFDQRSCGENIIEKNKNLGATLADIKEIIEELKGRFSNQKIILLGEGFGAALISYFSKNENIEKIVISSTRLNLTYRKTLFFYLKLWFGVAFKSNALLFQAIDGLDLTDDLNFANKLEDENKKNGAVTIREYFQFKKITKNMIKNINNSNAKVEMLLANNDFYCSPKKMVILINKLNKNKFKFETLKNKKHFMLNSKNSSEIFEKIIKSI